MGVLSTWPEKRGSARESGQGGKTRPSRSTFWCVLQEVGSGGESGLFFEEDLGEDLGKEVGSICALADPSLNLLSVDGAALLAAEAPRSVGGHADVPTHRRLGG